jgi:copper(I)-binding protein
MSFKWFSSAVLLLAASVLTIPAAAHDFGLANLRIDHPYALPADAGQTGRVFFRTLKNLGRAPGRLVGASSPVADSTVVIGTVAEGAAIDIPGRSATKIRHDQSQWIELRGLKEALTEGDEFPLTLSFEGLGEKEITVTVQRPSGY